MLNILFCYAKENPHVAYRQGMHELLAPLLFVLHAEDRGDLTSDDSMRYQSHGDNSCPSVMLLEFAFLLFMNHEFNQCIDCIQNCSYT